MLDLFQNEHLHQEIYTLIIIALYLFFKYYSKKIIKKSALINQSLDHRTNLVIKYVSILLICIAIIAIVIIWGVNKDQLFLFFSSLFTVIGVAFFAQWSLLSNITAGVILFISYPFKIGDSIKIHDKDFPIHAEIVNIKAFYLLLKTDDGEITTYPNILLMQKGISVISNDSE
ncbi:mechanosensitive ion channel family protein [uncultured Flavobacterium sp.]|uniref:mechanosensitive ion channel family protein n=1 Tax=uncultured Flavobacterium sp. TaxID=165435 RepID=UPI0030CA396F|tara:strand:+ start:2864 stop:3382 length:519 start_codon:yes stop_codon:yes gene_type:complete